MSRGQALVLAGHGSQRHPGAAAPLHDHADRIRESGRFDEVAVAFWKEEPSLREVTATLSADVAYVVPVLTSEGYFADRVFPRELGVSDAGDAPGDVEVRYAEPVGTHHAMTDVIAARIETAVEGSPAAAGVALVGHGTERHEQSARSTIEHALRLRVSGRYAEVAALFLDEDPYVGDLGERVDAEEVVVVPVFVADGHHTTTDIPEAIGHPGVGETATVDGRRVHYTGAVGTEPRLADVIVERAVEAGATVEAGAIGGRGPAEAPVGPAAPESSPRPADEAFLRRVDSTSGGGAWGQLSITRGPDGYELRHRDDADAPRHTLEPLGGPSALRERVRFDDRGRYRPLSGADTLPTGWVLPELEPAELLRAVRFVYPASVALWWRERTGALEVTHFADSVARQTGIYADLDGFDGAALEAAAEAVCGTCVRRRRWEAGSDEPIDAPGGEGEIPCREACPFFLAAAHEFDVATGEGGADPTPVEAEDPGVPAGAFEEPGNRYRTRFARALARRRDAGRDDSGAAAATPGGER